MKRGHQVKLISRNTMLPRKLLLLCSSNLIPFGSRAYRELSYYSNYRWIAFGMTDQSIGIMEGAFFVPATELLAWINSMLELDI